MPLDCEHELKGELGQGERLLWLGRPRQGVRFHPIDIFLVPFSLFWGGIAISWEAIAIWAGAPFSAVLVGIPFLLIGLYIMIGRFFVDSYQRARSCYGVTDQRIVIVSGVIQRQVRSLSLRSLSDVSLTERPDRSGTISFGPTGAMNGPWLWGASWPGVGFMRPPIFDRIASARKVYELICQAQRAAE